MAEENKAAARYTPGPRRVRTVEHDPGWGWIARDPQGHEVIPGFRWASRSIARCVAKDPK